MGITRLLVMDPQLKFEKILMMIFGYKLLAHQATPQLLVVLLYIYIYN